MIYLMYGFGEVRGAWEILHWVGSSSWEGRKH